MRFPRKPLPLPHALDTCLEGRQSRRPDRRSRPPTREEIGTLLRYAARGPSAGGLHVLRFYYAPDTLARFVGGNALEPLDPVPSPLPLLLEWAGNAMDTRSPPPGLILLARRGGPAEKKYGRDAKRLVQMDAGAAYAILGLVSAALHLPIRERRLVRAAAPGV